MTPSPAGDLLGVLAERGLTLAVAESLTGGLLGASVTAVPGASAVFRGGVLAYATEVKTGVLGVAESVVDEHGVVSQACAEAMAERARSLLHADVGLATTGVAGPDPQEGRPPGTVHVAVAFRGSVAARALQLTGDRESVRRDTVVAVCDLARDRIAGNAGTA